MIFGKGIGKTARHTFFWDDIHKGENVMYRIPENIKWNDNVVVREDEYAVFFRDGKALHVFDRPGRYAMTTLNVPVLGTLGAVVTGIRQLGEIYYIQKREFRGKFGTSEPLTFRDTDFGVLRIRVFGEFAYKIVDPILFITQFVGSEGMSTSEEVVGWIKSQLIMGVNDMLGELKKDKQMGVLDMPAYLQEMEQIVLSKVSADTERYGVKITKIAGLNVNLPKEVQDSIDKRAAMSTLGTTYIQYQTGKAIEGVGVGAATGGGNGAGATVGLGAGVGIGYSMASAIAQQQQVQPPFPLVQKKDVKCAKCGAMAPENVKFCPNCGSRMVSADMMVCPKCNEIISKDVKFCPNCGTKMTSKCSHCNHDVKFGMKFCPNCGAKIES